MTVDQLTPPAFLPDIVNALAVSPQDDSAAVCFAARNSGLYRSMDGGLNWLPAYDTLLLQTELTTTAVAVAPLFGNGYPVFAGVNGGVLRSRDSGTTWQISQFPDPPPLVTAVAVSPQFVDDGVIFAGTMEDGMFRSADRGSSWAAWNFGLLDLGVLAIAISPTFDEDETVFVGTGSGLFRSTNGGRAWREVELPSSFAPVLSIALVSEPRAALYIGTEGSGLYRSIDNGMTWQQLGETSFTGAVNTILPRVSELLVLHNDLLMVSTDDGQSWATMDGGNALDGGVASVAALPNHGTHGALLVGLVEGDVVRL